MGWLQFTLGYVNIIIISVYNYTVGQWTQLGVGTGQSVLIIEVSLFQWYM